MPLNCWCQWKMLHKITILCYLDINFSGNQHSALAAPHVYFHQHCVNSSWNFMFSYIQYQIFLYIVNISKIRQWACTWERQTPLSFFAQMRVQPKKSGACSIVEPSKNLLQSLCWPRPSGQNFVERKRPDEDRQERFHPGRAGPVWGADQMK